MSQEATQAAAQTAAPFLAGSMNGLPFMSPPISFSGGPATGGTAASNPIFGGSVQVSNPGINLGEILSNFEGPPENGGFGLEKSWRGTSSIAMQSSVGGFPLWMIATAGFATLVVFMKRKR